MSLGPTILKLLDKKYAPLTMVEQKFKGYDLSFKTDAEGLPILLFIGKRDENGNIRGERYARRLARDQEGVIIKDHWDFKRILIGEAYVGSAYYH